MPSFLDRFRKDPSPKPDRKPLAAAGREHTAGFIVVEEHNPDLIGFRGYETYDKMYRTDGDVRQVIQLVSNPVVSGTWESVPYGGQEADDKAVEEAAIVKWAFWQVMNPNILQHFIQMIPVLARSGNAPYEILWTTADYKGKTYLVPRKLDLRLPRTIQRFYQDEYGDLVSIVQHLPVPLDSLIARGYDRSIKTTRKASDGTTLMPGEVEIFAKDLLYYRLGAEGDNWEGVSLLRPAYKHWYMKDTIEKIDAMAQEREAMGVPICYPPIGADGPQLTAMENVLGNMRTNEQGYIVMPGPKAGAGAPDGQGWLVEVIGYDRTGSGRDPQPSLKYHTDKIAAAFISEFMRLGHGQVGARATAQVQADPFLMSIESLVTVIEATFNELVLRFCAYNGLSLKGNPPKVQMSLVDSTSLTSLADYVLKLCQVGALFPDQELENFLRARADLPPSNPKSVQKRGQKDDDMRREVVIGGGPNGDAVGQNDRPGTPHGTKTAKPKATGSSAKRLSANGEEERWHRPLRDYELGTDFEAIEDYLDAQPDDYKIMCQSKILDYAKSRNADLRDELKTLLQGNYDHGYALATGEVDAILTAPQTLSVRDKGLAGLDDRCKHAEDYIKSAMRLASSSAALNYGDDSHEVQLAAEREGMRALKHIGWHHGGGAFAQGRHDAITLAAQEFDIGMTYSALLDRKTCHHCELADDGVPRKLDDPVRLDRRPPNRHCESNASGHNWCRCIEIPTLITE